MDTAAAITKLLLNPDSPTFDTDLANLQAGIRVAAKGRTGANYNTRLGQEIDDLYSGRYGTEGAREKVIDILRNEFPNVDVSSDVYSRAPDGYEAHIKGEEEEVEEYLNPDYLKEQFGSRLNTKKILKAAGVASVWDLQKTEYANLISNLMTLVNNYRTAGYNDDEISDVILKKIEGWEK